MDLTKLESALRTAILEGQKKGWDLIWGKVRVVEKSNECRCALSMLLNANPFNYGVVWQKAVAQHLSDNGLVEGPPALIERVVGNFVAGYDFPDLPNIATDEIAQSAFKLGANLRRELNPPHYLEVEWVKNGIS